MGAEEIIAAKIEKTMEAAETALRTAKTKNYETLEAHVRGLEDMARESFQHLVREEYESIVRKLESNVELSSREREVLELLIVGSAEHYLREEEEFEHWLEELRRLTSEMERLKSQELLSVDTLIHLQALSRDARQLLPNINFYLTERDRIERFREAMQGPLDASSANALVGILRGMMSSTRM